jgi:hypothetical protein
MSHVSATCGTLHFINGNEGLNRKGELYFLAAKNRQGQKSTGTIRIGEWLYNLRHCLFLAAKTPVKAINEGDHATASST